LEFALRVETLGGRAVAEGVPREPFESIPWKTEHSCAQNRCRATDTTPGSLGLVTDNRLGAQFDRRIARCSERAGDAVQEPACAAVSIYPGLLACALSRYRIAMERRAFANASGLLEIRPRSQVPRRHAM